MTSRHTLFERWRFRVGAWLCVQAMRSEGVAHVSIDLTPSGISHVADEQCYDTVDYVALYHNRTCSRVPSRGKP